MTGFRAIAAAATALALVAGSAAAQMQGYPGHYDGHIWGGGWHGWFLGPLMMLFWIAILAGAVFLVLRLAGLVGPGAKRQDKAGSDALDILRERFARGEIDKAEFEERRALLDG